MDYFGTFEIKAVDFGQRIIKAYAAVHNNIDRVRDIIDPQATAKAVSRIKNPADIPVFVGHSEDQLPIGIPQRIEAHPRGLYTETMIKPGPVGDDLLHTARFHEAQGIPLGLSIKYRTRDSRHEQTHRGRVRRILDYDLFHYCFASPAVTANPEATAVGFKLKRRGQVGDFAPTRVRAKALSAGSDTAGGFVVPADRKEAGMQYRVEQEDGKWCVYCDSDNDGDGDDSRMVGRYPDEATANAVVMALRKEGGSAGPESGEDNSVDDEDPRKTVGVKADWSTAYQNSLPDSSFLYVEAGGQKDEDGRTVPRGKRHLPYKDANGKIDLPHLRNAISRLGQDATLPGLDDAKKAALAARARRLLERAGDGKTTRETEEWKTGAPLDIRALGYRLIDLSEQVAEELKAMRLLGEETKANARIRQPLRAAASRVGEDLTQLIGWAAKVDAGEDARALRERYEYELMVALDI